jgi:hypothetical protein
MREIRSSGSVRGASGDGRPYRERNLAIGGRISNRLSGEINSQRC